jgi:hypothetical protein
MINVVRKVARFAKITTGNVMKHVAIIVAGAVCLGALNALAVDAPKPNPFTTTLSAVPAPELPAQAAALVKQARTREWGKTTISVVKAAVGLNPAAAPLVVSAIAQSVPEMASVAAATAAEEQPRQAVAIAKAAATAAPSKVAKIVVAVCRVAQDQYRAIALAVSEACPSANREILKAVAASFPSESELKRAIEKSLAEYSGSLPPVASILDQAIAAASIASAVSPSSDSRGPSVSVPPPAQQPSGTPTALTPAQSGSVPANGRNYAPP